MRYRLFCSDFDGTLVRGDGTVSEKNRNAIEAYKKAGGIFAVCTGRGLPSILPRVRELNIKGLVVACQGAVIAEIESGKLLKDDHFPVENAIRVVKMLEEDGKHFHVYTSHIYYSNQDDEYLEAYEQVCGVKAEIEPKMSKLLEKKRLTVNKILVIIPPEERDGLRERYATVLGEEYYVTTSADCLVEVMPKGQNKGEAVRYLASHFGIPMTETAAIGDQLNDLPMIAVAAGKFTVSNGESDLKKLATVVASCEEDGVAEALALSMGG
jgi:hypothetical protein